MCKKLIFLIPFILVLVAIAEVASAENIWLEAESADLITSPMETLSDDPNASGGEYIGAAVGTPQVANASPAPNGTASYIIDVEGGTYKLVIRTKCDPREGDWANPTELPAADSCWIRLAGATMNTTALVGGFFKMNDVNPRLGVAREWEWVDAFNSDDGAKVMQFTLTAGYYTLEVSYREDGMYFDGYLLTTDLALDAATLPDKIPGRIGKSELVSPRNRQIDVPRDVILIWEPWEYADTHNVFIGTDFNDVNDATIAEPLSTIVAEGLDVNNYDPGMLAYGQTYFWRVDEVNAPSNPGIFKGEIWQFTIEPIAYKIPAENITATASSSYSGYDPNRTIDESGLDPNNMDLHTGDSKDMWLSSGADVNDVWIRYDFDKIYKLHEMMVWNFNFDFVQYIEAGFKDVTVEYSEDGETWTQLANVPVFEKGTGSGDYMFNTVVDFDGAIAQSVRLTVNSNWSNGLFPNVGLSEVRFTYIPVWPREPKPESGTTDVAVDQNLTWRAGRDADQHYLYIATDMNSVAGNIVSPVILDETSYSPSIVLGHKYYWKVDEVNNAEAYPVWDGPVWNFSTVESIVVENFEVGYDDTDANAVWATWIDGFGNSANGSQMGNTLKPYLSTMNHNGGHSSPILYDNTSASSSEVTALTFDLPIGTSNWSIGSPTTLVIWVYGDPGNNTATDMLYAKIGSAKIPFTGDISKPRWTQFNINLSTAGINLNNVPSITIGIERIGATGGSGIIYLDDMRLYNVPPVKPSEEIWLEAEAADVLKDRLATIYTEFAGASGGAYIGLPQGSGNANGNNVPVGDANTASYTFTVTGGVYSVDYRMYNIGGAGSDSTYQNISTATAAKVTNGDDAVFDPTNSTIVDGWVRNNNLASGANWHWVTVISDRNSNQDLQWTLPAGTHTLKVAAREDGLFIDAILIWKVE